MAGCLSLPGISKRSWAEGGSNSVLAIQSRGPQASISHFLPKRFIKMQRSDHFSFSPIAAGILYPFYYPLMLQNESHIRLQAISHWPYFRSVGMILPEAFVFRLPNTMKSHYHSDLNLHSQASPEVLSMEAGPGQGWAGPALKSRWLLVCIFKSRDITLPIKVRLVKAMVFPVVMYGCESWTVALKN